MIEQHIKRYVFTSALYGLVRKVCWLYDAKVEEYDRKTEQKVIKPMLWCDKVLISTICTMTAPVYFPINVYLDVRYLEAKAKNHQTTDADVTSVIEQLMS